MQVSNFSAGLMHERPGGSRDLVQPDPKAGRTVPAQAQDTRPHSVPARPTAANRASTTLKAMSDYRQTAARLMTLSRGSPANGSQLKMQPQISDNTPSQPSLLVASQAECGPTYGGELGSTVCVTAPNPNPAFRLGAEAVVVVAAAATAAGAEVPAAAVSADSTRLNAPAMMATGMGSMTVSLQASMI